MECVTTSSVSLKTFFQNCAFVRRIKKRKNSSASFLCIVLPFFSLLEPHLCSYSNKAALPFHYNDRSLNLLVMCYDELLKPCGFPHAADHLRCNTGFLFFFYCFLYWLRMKTESLIHTFVSFVHSYICFFVGM